MKCPKCGQKAKARLHDRCYCDYCGYTGLRYPKKKILAIIPTFNPGDVSYDESFEDFTHSWFGVIQSLRKQRSNNLHIDIVVADNVSGEKTRKMLKKFQKKENDFDINFIDDFYGTPCTPFNLTLAKYKNKDDYDCYCYCSSDVFFNNNGDFQLLLDDMDENCCIIFPYVDNDMIQRIDDFKKFGKNKKPVKLDLARSINMHFCVIKKEFMEAYDYKLIDIISGGKWGMEDFMSYQCAAIGCHMLLSSKVCMHHIGMGDRKKAFATERECRTLFSPQYKRDFFKMLDEGSAIGLGFQEHSEDISVYKNIYFNAPYCDVRYFLRHVVFRGIVVSSFFKNIYGNLTLSH